MNVAAALRIVAALPMLACSSGGGTNPVEPRGRVPELQNVIKTEGRDVQLDEATARQRATALASAKFRRTKLVDAAGRPIATPSPSPSAFKARVENGRWHLSFGGPAGAWADVSFDLTGANESVEVGFAAD